MTFRQPSIFAYRFCCALIGACLACGGSLQAQDPRGEDGFGYQQLKVDIELRRKGREIDSTLRGINDELGDKEKLFNDYFRTYHLPRFTTEDEIANLPELRADLKERFQLAYRNTKIRTHLSNLVFKFMFNLAREETFHPASRVNAVLVLGDLDDPTTGKGGTDPWMTTLPQLLEIAGSDKFPDGMRVAAMVGIRRRTQSPKLPPNAVEPVINPMLALAGQTTAPASRSEEGHIWMRRKAMDVLADLKSPGQGMKVLSALFAVAKNTSEPIEIRGAAINTLVVMPLEKVPNFDSRLLAAVIADIVITATEAETEADPESQLGFNPRRLVSRIQIPADSMRPLLAIAKADQREAVAEIDRYVDAILRDAKSTSFEEEEQRRRLERLVTLLKEKLQSSGLKRPAPPEES